VDEARRWIEAARLVTLRGIGTVNARRLAEIGVTSVAALAIQDPDALAGKLAAKPGERRLRPTLAEVRVWVRAALDAVLATAS